jgi:predicted transcriptional regulator
MAMPGKVKRPSTADVLINPRRLEVIRAFQTSGPLTVRELGGIVRSISESTLYRHVRLLERVGALAIAETRRKERGAPETVYVIPDHPLETVHLRGQARSPANMRRYFLAVQGAQLAEFEARLKEGPIEGRLAAMRYAVIYVNPAELREVRAMLARLKELATNRDARRMALSLSFTLFPAPSRDQPTRKRM